MLERPPNTLDISQKKVQCISEYKLKITFFLEKVNSNQVCRAISTTFGKFDVFIIKTSQKCIFSGILEFESADA